MASATVATRQAHGLRCGGFTKMCAEGVRILVPQPHILDRRLSMRVIMTMALATGFAVSQFQVEATAAGPPPPLQQTAQADCGTASATGSAGDKDQHMAGPGCSAASLGSRLAERRPGFWTADDAAPAPGQVVSEPRSAI